MPELPEVETVRRTLKNFILERPILGIDVYYDRIIQGDTQLFVKSLQHEIFCDIDRVGKYLIFKCQNHAFVSHLRMEGKFHIVESDEPVSKHTHVVFHMDRHQDLRYIDTRKFGRMELVSLDDYREQLPLKKLGPEPFEITTEALYERLHHCSLPIKTALLDQSMMCGIGNIYANEICFYMHIDPRTKASRLSRKRVDELRKVAIMVLQSAVEQGGTTIHSFDANGIHGLFQVQLKVHGQKVCPVCHHDIKKVMVHQRGTYFCPQCQKKRY